MAATNANHAATVNLLLEYGTDPDRLVDDTNLQHACAALDARPGERALHLAGRRGNVEVVRVLLRGARADINATDKAGYTPLNATCDSPHASVEVV